MNELPMSVKEKFALGVVLSLVTLLIVLILGLSLEAVKFSETRPSTYEIRLTQVADCQAREQFTTEQCVILAGGE